MSVKGAIGVTMLKTHKLYICAEIYESNKMTASIGDWYNHVKTKGIVTNLSDEFMTDMIMLTYIARQLYGNTLPVSGGNPHIFQRQ